MRSANNHSARCQSEGQLPVPGLSGCRLVLRLALCCAAVFAVGLAAADAEAGHWSFRRSYYSHDLPPAVARHYPAPESRSAYRRPYVHTTSEFSIRGGYRNNYIFMRSGLSTDVTVVREDWYQLGR